MKAEMVDIGACHDLFSWNVVWLHQVCISVDCTQDDFVLSPYW